MIDARARLFIFGPIPSPSDWLIASDELAPAGFLKLCSLSIAPRTAAKDPGSAQLVALQQEQLVPSQEIEALPSVLARLLRAYALLDAAGRAEILRHAEQLGSVP